MIRFFSLPFVIFNTLLLFMGNQPGISLYPNSQFIPTALNTHQKNGVSLIAQTQSPFASPDAVPGDFGKTTPVDGATSNFTDMLFVWEDSTGATSYEFCIDVDVDGTCQSWWFSTGMNTQIFLSDLEFDTPYEWQVRARNNDGITYSDGGPATAWSFTLVPPAPDNFDKTSPGDTDTEQPTSLTLDWGASTGAIGYEYCIDDSPGDGCMDSWHATEAAATQVDIGGLLNDTTYEWQVRATNTGGTAYADGDTWWTFTTVEASPATFSKISPGDAVENQPISLMLQWVTSTDATDYEYCYDSTVNAFCNDSWTPTTLTGADISGLAYGTRYEWQVRASNDNPDPTGANSGAWWTFTTVEAPPVAFSKTSPVDAATNQPVILSLHWEPSSNATSYEYCFYSTDSTDCDGSWTSTTSTSVTTPLLNYDTGYHWQVRSLNTNPLSIDADSGVWWTFTTQVAGDAYEYDDVLASAKIIQHGITQDHTIIPATDVDWATFSLTTESAISLTTSGESGNTRMWLYDDTGLVLIANDDGSPGHSGITRTCRVDALPAGTYYVKVDESGNDHEIANYSLSFSIIRSCNDGREIFIPMLFRPSLATPVMNAVSNSGQVNFTLTWNSIAGATTYTVWESLTSDFSSFTIQDSGGSNFLNLTRGPTRYYYYVKATDGFIYSNPSNIESVDVTHELEDNDTGSTANGPLLPGIDYYGYPDDPADYYKFFMSTPGTINVTLAEPAGYTFQLQLFYNDLTSPNRVGYVYTSPYQITYSGAAGWYYIFIPKTGGANTTEKTYTLRVSY